MSAKYYCSIMLLCLTFGLVATVYFIIDCVAFFHDPQRASLGQGLKVMLDIALENILWQQFFKHFNQAVMLDIAHLTGDQRMYDRLGGVIEAPNLAIYRCQTSVVSVGCIISACFVTAQFAKKIDHQPSLTNYLAALMAAMSVALYVAQVVWRYCTIVEPVSRLPNDEEIALAEPAALIFSPRSNLRDLVLSSREAVERQLLAPHHIAPAA